MTKLRLPALLLLSALACSEEGYERTETVSERIGVVQRLADAESCPAPGFSPSFLETKVEVSAADIDRVRAEAASVPTNADNLLERVTVLDEWRNLLVREAVDPYDCGFLVRSVSDIEDLVRLTTILDYRRYGADPGEADALLEAILGDPEALYQDIDAVFAIYERQSNGRKRVLFELGPASRYTYVERGVSLQDLASRDRANASPITSGRYVNDVQRDGDSVVFTYRAPGDLPLTYRWTPTGGTLDGLTAQIGAQPAFQIAAGGGPTVEFHDARMTTASPGERTLLSIESTRRSVQATFGWRPTDAHTYYVFTEALSIEGKTLSVAFSSEQNHPALSARQLTAGRLSIPLQAVIVPYLISHQVFYAPEQAVFVSSLFDWSQSGATQMGTVGRHASATRYDLTNNARNESIPRTRPALQDVLHITVSPELNEVLPSVPGAPSPGRADLVGRVVLDEWHYFYDGLFGQLTAGIAELAKLGVEGLAVVSHSWAGELGDSDKESPQRVGEHPMPTSEELNSLSTQVADIGGRLALHNSYHFLGDGFEVDDPWDTVLLGETGGPRGPEHKKVRLLKPAAKLRLADPIEGDLNRRFNTTGSFHDVSTALPPWWFDYVDHDASEPMAAQFRANVVGIAQLFDALRATHGGPIFGEARAHYLWGGIIDATEAENGNVGHGSDWNRNAMVVDFDLLKIQPIQANHGMGYPERWLDWGNTDDSRPGWGPHLGMTQLEQDRYRSQEIAFGHAGYVTTQDMRGSDYAIREYSFMSELQTRMLSARVTDIRYAIGDRWEPASRAIPYGDTRRVRVAYDSGLVVWTNHADVPWRLAVPGRGPITLPSSGFVASAPDLYAYTAVVGSREDGQALVGDYLESPALRFADARSAPPSGPRVTRYRLRGDIAGEPSGWVQGALKQLLGPSNSDKVEVIALRDHQANRGDGSSITVGPLTTNGIIAVRSVDADEVELLDLAMSARSFLPTHALDLGELAPQLAQSRLQILAYDTDGAFLACAQFTKSGPVVTFTEVDRGRRYRIVDGANRGCQSP